MSLCYEKPELNTMGGKIVTHSQKP